MLNPKEFYNQSTKVQQELLKEIKI